MNLLNDKNGEKRRENSEWNRRRINGALEN